MIRPYSQLLENEFTPHIEIMKFSIPETNTKPEIIENQQVFSEDKKDECNETSISIIDESSLKDITPKHLFRRK